MFLPTPPTSSSSCTALLRRLAPILALVCLFGLGHAAGANTLTVPAQYATIQAAINAAQNGDTVLISDGTYTGPGNVDLDFGGRNITVTSVNGAATTIINCQGSSTDYHRGFYLHSGETLAVISGLTIENGYESNGGGIDNENSTADTITVLNCILTGNTAYQGGGIYVHNDIYHTINVAVTNCTLTGNTANYGGGYASLNGGVSTIALTNCTFSGNIAQDGDGDKYAIGGGAYNDNNNGGTITVAGCTFSGNTARSSVGNPEEAGGLYNYNYLGTITVTGCTFTANTAPNGLGGGILNYVFNSPITISNCALTGNTAGSGGGNYDFNYSQGTVNLTNCTLTGNAASPGKGGGLYDDNYSNSGATVLTNDLLYGDAGGEYFFVVDNYGFAGSPVTANDCDVEGGYTGKGTGDFSSDPLFVNAPTDLHLQAGSPCLGAGTASGAPATTLDGRTRPNPPSVGAYEITLINTTTALTSSLNPSVLGQGVTFTATVTGAGGMPTGTVTFSVDGTAQTPIALSNGSAAFSTASLPGGSHTITAAYSGDTTFAPGTSSALTQTVSIPHVSPQYVSPSGSDSNLGTVSSPKLTIQAAINATLSGDTVVVGDGTYTGPGNVDLDFGGRNITVTSQNGAAVTIINCGGNPYVNHRGFYLHSGETNAVISGLTIENGCETNYSFGGGISNTSPGLTVLGCTFSSNSAFAGGGLYNNPSSGTTVVNNCVFISNLATNYGAGGGIYSNTDFGTMTVTNCTLIGNKASLGGGISCNSNGALTATNDILYGDSGGEIGGSNVTANHCDIGGGYAGTGNISADPLFVNSPTDLHLRPGSPCLGAGTANGAPTTTMDGMTRPNPPSIGAYEAAPRAATTTTLTSSLNPSAAGQSVTFTANVAGGGGTPTGTVTFTIDGAAQTPVMLSNGYYAALSTSSLAVGSHTVTAAYSGDANFAPSASSALTQTVLAATTVTVASAFGAAGQTVTLSATLAKTGGAALSGATLSFSVDGTPVGTALTNSSGVATLRYVVPSALAVGGHTVAAAFSGDGGDAASSGGGALTVTKGGVALAVAAAAGSPGQAVTLKATLKRVSDGAALGGETVSFSVDGAVVGAVVTSSAGLAVLTYTVPANATLGSHALAAAFAGDGTYSAGTGKATLTVKAATQVAVANVSGARGTTVTLSAALTTAAGSPLPGRTVTFTVDGKAVGTATTDGTGTAIHSYPIPATNKVGAHSVGASFAGDNGNAPSNSKGTLTVH